MACYHPLTAYLSGHQINNATGKAFAVFHLRKLTSMIVRFLCPAANVLAAG